MPDPKPDYYRILGVTRTATKIELKKAYYRLARQFHPDVCQIPGAEAKFKRINEAYQILSNQLRRSEYDQQTRPIWEWDGRAAYPDFGLIDQFITSYFDDKGNVQREYACLFNCPHCGSEATVFFNQTILSWQNCTKRCDVCAKNIAIDFEIQKDKVTFFEARVGH